MPMGIFLLVDRQILSKSVATTEQRQVVLECHAFTSYDSKTHEVGQKINWMKVNNLSGTNLLPMK